MTQAEVLHWFRMLRRHGLNNPISGNASDRSGITRTGCNADGELELVSWDSPTRSQDAPIHELCYEQRKDIDAILHAHAPYTVATDGLRFIHGPISVIKADWNTEKERIALALIKHGIVLHHDHGVYACYENAEEAYSAICAIEHSARTAFIRWAMM